MGEDGEFVSYFIRCAPARAVEAEDVGGVRGGEEVVVVEAAGEDGGEMLGREGGRSGCGGGG